MIEFEYRSTCPPGRVKVLVGVSYVEELGKLAKEYTSCIAIIPKSLEGVVKAPCHMVPIIDGEAGKDIGNVVKIAQEAYNMGLDRGGLFVGIGGGSVLDVAGFAASIYMRGVDYVNVPSTTLAMVDAALGGKTGVNALGLKNVLGIIRQPREIIIDLNLLKTLPYANYIDGFAEVVKYGVTLDRGILNIVEGHYADIANRDFKVLEELVYRSLRVKASVVEADEEDRLGLRIVLNYGHTVGHALEAASNFTISHGRAVAMGMVCEALVGEKMGYTPAHVVDEVKEVLKRLNLIQDVKVDKSLVARAIMGDKKRRGGNLKIPMVTDLGSWIPVEVKVDEYVKAVADICGFTAS